MHRFLNHCQSRRMPVRNRMQGISVVEILVSMVIGLLLMVAVAGVYVSGQQSFQFASNYSAMQEGARVALEELARDVRHAGFMGCHNTADVDSSTASVGGRKPTPIRIAVAGAPTGQFYLPANYLDASTQVVGGPATALVLPSSTVVPVAGTEYVQVQYGQPVAFMTGLQNSDPGSPFPLNKSINVVTGMPFVIATCAQALVVRATNGSFAGMNLDRIEYSPGLLNNTSVTSDFDFFGKGSTVSTILTATYFLGIDSGNGSKNLYRWEQAVAGNRVEVLLHNVEDFQLVYGVDTSATLQNMKRMSVKAWRTASQVTSAGQWPFVLSVTAGILVRSEQKASGSIPSAYVWNPGARSYSLAGAATDQYFRRPYLVTATIRGRADLLSF